MTAGRYSGRVAIVTGARRGVGRIIAEHLLAEGATVVGLARGTSTIADPAYRHTQVDVTDSAAVAKAVRGVAKEHGGIDLVINNAAVLTSQYAMIMPAENAQAMVLTNLLAPFIVAREAAKVMRKARAGRIINVGSMAASLEPVGDSIYAACKAALTTLSGVLAKEFGSFGVTVNTVAITAIETDMLAQLPRDKIDAIVAALPIARYAVADDICNVVDFFADDRSSYITAQTLYLGGVH
jgi:3-oxoacyl-[acyl-carrier protein] reductase